MTISPRRILVLAGYDPSGGAGISADREAAQSLGVIADCVVTVDTEQSDGRVSAIRPRPSELWLAEAQAFLRADPQSRPRVLKSSLLVGAEQVQALARLAAAEAELPLVLDPVLSASGGELFLDDAALEVLRTELLPLGPIITPNLPETARLLGVSQADLASCAARERAAEQLLAWGASAVLLKGGHADEDPIRDLCARRGAAPIWHEHQRVPGPGIHGSGCRYASRVAASLALGTNLAAAAADAGHYLRALIAKARTSPTPSPDNS